ncbi:zinc finger B-box domain-containing protein 1 isoform X1 [Dromiciops gliroides]|uniref:zinc finger B-box domain-containing protein 1 isoform X1 n=1 Tax=Dromiciops gliroides TaxID=33562 RepID=UPI001CC50043|nr:zinc finger B-box domain-containing protein 1 isoform X1 [Dromiciops gliroides]XP_043852153.1 zinc finger B-box domain-containing protein 1 isoform X1 [Dromiciops gliroides]
MNTNDFIVLPWGKPGNSVKLKTKNVRELRVEKVQLELETQEMEKKLQQLQSSMSREKEERERSSGYHWKSGQSHKLGNQSQVMSQNKENVKISPGKVKFKILKDQVQETPKQQLNHKMTNICAQEKIKGKGKVCGQCENKFALLVCLECGEDYCSACFARIHQKGALKRHRTTLLQTRAQVLSRLDIAHRFLKEIYPDESREEQNLKKEISKDGNASKTRSLQISDPEVDSIPSKKVESTNQTGGLLLQGSFDEEESARSFQEILTQWRNGNPENKVKHIQKNAETSPEQTEASEVQTNLKIWREPLQIEFKEDSLTYVERLWLKKHRRTLLHCTKNVSLEKELSPSIPICELPSPLAALTEDITLNEKDDNIEVEELKESYPDPFQPEQPELENLESSVKIVELDDNYEEEPGESGDFVPYKIELADTDSQQSWAVHQYRKNDFHFVKDLPFSLMKAIDAMQQHGFSTKEKDLFSQCSRTISSASKETLKVSLSRSSTSDSPPITENVSTVSIEKNVTKKKSFLLENKKPDEKIYSSHQRTPYHCNVDSGDSHGERLRHNRKDFLEGNNLHENSNSQGPRSMKSSKLQKIALRSKPITEQYQGLEKFFVFGKNPFKERFGLNLAMRSGISPSNSRITLTGNQQWIYESSLSEHADDSIVQDVVWNNQKKVSGVLQPKRGYISKRPSSANIPICKTILNGSRSYTSLHQRPRSAASRPISRATSEISEIEYLDVTDQDEPFLEDAADHQTLENLERELNTLKNLSDAPERLYSLNYEKLSSISRYSEKISNTMTDVPKTPGLRDSSRLDISSLDAEVHGLLSSSESSIDEEEENSLERLQVVALH